MTVPLADAETYRNALEALHQVHVATMEAMAVRGARIKVLEDLLIEATAELIYLRQYGKDGAVWWANESKDVWRDKAIATLAEPRP
jgi:hypothetical protein